jgi:uncharacterized protein YndB with AHSA1/START domain
MSELVMTVRMAQTFEQVSAAFEDPFLMRRWYGAPPGCHRIGGAGSLAPGEAFQVHLIDAEGDPFTQIGRILSVTPGEAFEMEMTWEGGGLGRETTRAFLTLRSADGGTHLELRQGPFSSPEAQEAHQAFWEACLGRLARVASGEAVPCFEEFWEESHGFFEPLGMAAYTVLAGMREAGAAPEVIAQVEEALYAHLARVPEETAGVLAAVLRGRLKKAAA